MSHLIKPIPIGTTTWSVTINGEPQTTPIQEVRMSHPKFGMLSFGLRPEGTIGWMWKEVGGGGVGIIPYFCYQWQLYVGMIQQERHCQGGLVWNIPRGFLDPSLTHFESVRAEAHEELGMDQVERFIPLVGEPANSNSTFFDTSEPGEGFRYYGLEISHAAISHRADPLEFISGLFRPKTMIAERILACKFFPWDKAATVGDQFSNVAVIRLLATFHHLREYIREYVI